MYKATSPSSGLLRLASSGIRFSSASTSSSNSPLVSRALASSSRLSGISSSSLLGSRSIGFSRSCSSLPRPLVRSFGTWRHGNWRSPVSLRAQIRSSAVVIERFQRKMATLATENPFKNILTSLPKPRGGEFGKFYSLPALNDPRIGNACAKISLGAAFVIKINPPGSVILLQGNMSGTLV